MMMMGISAIPVREESLIRQIHRYTKLFSNVTSQRIFGFDTRSMWWGCVSVVLLSRAELYSWTNNLAFPLSLIHLKKLATSTHNFLPSIPCALFHKLICK